MLSACTSHDDAAGQPTVSTAERIPLEIGIADTGAATATRTNTIGNTADYFNSGQLDGTTFSTEGKVGVFVRKKDGNASTDNSYEKNNLKIESFSTFADNYSQLAFTEATSLADNGSTTGKLYYPEVTDQQIDIYAYAPWQEAPAPADWTNISTQTTDITLQLDQTAIADYKKSDVLWGCSGTGTNVATAVTGENGAYKLLDKDGLNNNNEISANKYIEVRDGATATNGPVAGTTYYYYKAGEATRAVPKVIVPMLHRGAKVIVKLSTHGMDQNKLRNATVRMQWPYRVGTLNVSTGEFTGAADQNFAGDGVLTNENDNTKQAWQYVLTSRLGIQAVTTGSGEPVEEGVETTGGDPGGTSAATDDHGFYTCTGIVVPGQSLTWDNLFEVDLYAKTTAHTDGAESDNPIVSTYSWKPTSQLTLKSGKQYTFEITITADQMTVALSIEDWENGTLTTSGTGLTPVEGTSTRYTFNAAMDIKKDPQVGDLYFSDGTWGTLADNTSGSEKAATDVIGIVFSTETSGIDKSLGYRRGYVMALKHATTVGVSWCTSDKASTAYTDRLLATTDKGSYSSIEEAHWYKMTGDLDGLTHCQTAKSKNNGNYEGLTAMKAAEDYNTTVPAPATSSRWYLPSVGQTHQWDAQFAVGWSNYSTYYGGTNSGWIYRNSSGQQDFHIVNSRNALIGAINTYLETKLQGIVYDPMRTESIGYWSSSELSSTMVFNWNMCWAETLSYLSSDGKSDLRFVRPVLAF